MTSNYQKMNRDAQHWEEHKKEQEDKKEEIAGWRPDSTDSAHREADEAAHNESIKAIKQGRTVGKV